MRSQIAARYGKAFFETVPADTLQTLAEEFAQVLLVFEDPDIKRVFNHPATTIVRKIEMVKLMKLNKHLEQFLALIIEKKRDEFIPQIQAHFEELVLKSQQISVAEVISAVDLEEKTLNSIQSQLEKSLGKKVLIKHQVQPQIGGGLIIKVDGKIIDGSVANLLERFRQNLILSS